MRFTAQHEKSEVIFIY